MLEQILPPLFFLGLMVLFVLAIRSTSAEPETCGACGERFTSTRRMVPRPDLRICQDCVAAGLQRLDDLRRAATASPARVSAEAGRCQYCGLQAADATVVVTVAEAMICRECLFICQGLLHDPEPVGYEEGWRLLRDGLIQTGLMVLLTAFLLAMMMRSCLGS